MTKTTDDDFLRALLPTPRDYGGNMKHKIIIVLAALGLLVFCTSATADIEKKPTNQKAISAIKKATTTESGTQWYIEKKGNRHSEAVRIPTGMVVPVHVSGNWLFRLQQAKKQPFIKEQCTDERTDNLSNPTENEAHDEVQAMSILNCPEGVTVTAYTPWSGTLQGAGEPFTEPTSGMAIEVTTPGKNWGLFTGSMVGTYGDGDAKPCDDIDNILKFSGTSGALKNSEGAILELSVQDKYGEKGLDRALGERAGEPEESGVNCAGEGGGE